MMVNNQKKTILNRLKNFDAPTIERKGLVIINKDSASKCQIQSPQEQVATPRQQIPVPCKATLKRNIFANTIINKNAAKLMKSKSKNAEDSMNILQNEPINELMITDFERKIYDQLDSMGIRLADPLELQNDFYQKVRSTIFSQEDEINSERFLTPKISHSDKEAETRASSQVITSSDLDFADISKSADLQFLDSNIYLKRSSFKRPAILEQYTKSKTAE